MLKSTMNFIEKIFDYVLPPRSDFEIVKRLDEKAINSLPRAREVDGMDWISPLWDYKNEKVRAIVWELKYKGNTLPLDFIGKILYEEILALISDISIFNADAEFLLIPIPISEHKKHKRGYNQTEYIAKSILDHDLPRDLLYAPQWFQKIIETENQSHSVSKQERTKNLVGCFGADTRVSGKHIILIDDVVTTGTTLLEARSTLLSVGARDVFAFTLAH